MCKLAAGPFVPTFLPAPYVPIAVPPRPTFSFPTSYFLLVRHEEIRRHMKIFLIGVKETDRQPEKTRRRQDQKMANLRGRS